MPLALKFQALRRQQSRRKQFPNPARALLTAQARPAAQVDSQIMYAFYQRLFPFRYLFQWLNHSVKPSPDFSNREFAFTLQNDAYLRYQSFTTADLYGPPLLLQTRRR